MKKLTKQLFKVVYLKKAKKPFSEVAVFCALSIQKGACSRNGVDRF